MAVSDKSLNKQENSDTYGKKRKDEKKAALREYIQGQRYIQAINDDLDRVNITNEELPVIKFKTETRLKLLNKVLPDLKAIEHSGEDGEGIKLIHVIERQIVKANNTDA